MVGLAVLYGLWHMPHKDSALSSNRYDGSLVGGDSDLSDVTGVADTLEVADALIVIPYLNPLVLTAGHEVLSLLSNCKSVDLAGFGAIEHSNGLSIEAVPVGDLSV